MGFAYSIPTLIFVVVLFLTPLVLAGQDVAEQLGAAHRARRLHVPQEFRCDLEEPAVLAGGDLHA